MARSLDMLPGETPATWAKRITADCLSFRADGIELCPRCTDDKAELILFGYRRGLADGFRRWGKPDGQE